MGKTASKGAGGLTVGMAVTGAFMVALLIRFFILDFMVVEGYSMAPAIKPGTIVVVCKIYYGLKLPGSGAYSIMWRAPRAGDVVVFYTPLGEIAVKRCSVVFNGSFYALGDNGSQSYDSRDYGPVPFDNIIGKVLEFRSNDRRARAE